MIDKGPYTYQKINVEAQRRDPDSLLNWTTRMIRLRKECPEIGWGDWEFVKVSAPQVLAMRYTWRGSSLIVLHNFHGKAYEVQLKPQNEAEQTLINLWVNERSEVKKGEAHHILLEAYGYRWFRVGDLSPLLRDA